jgi:hypothetical protein
MNVMWQLTLCVTLCNQTTEKARKLKEARDYSFLFDDSPLPGPKIEQKKEISASSNLGKFLSAFFCIRKKQKYLDVF